MKVQESGHNFILFIKKNNNFIIDLTVLHIL